MNRADTNCNSTQYKCMVWKTACFYWTYVGISRTSFKKNVMYVNLQAWTQVCVETLTAIAQPLDGSTSFYWRTAVTLQSV